MCYKKGLIYVCSYVYLVSELICMLGKRTYMYVGYENLYVYLVSELICMLGKRTCMYTVISYSTSQHIDVLLLNF